MKTMEWRDLLTARVSGHNGATVNLLPAGPCEYHGEIRAIQKHRVGFAMGAYDSSKTLTIDPVITGEPAETGCRTRRAREMSVPAVRIIGGSKPLNPVHRRGFKGSASQLGEPGNQRWGTGSP